MLIFVFYALGFDGMSYGFAEWSYVINDLLAESQTEA